MCKDKKIQINLNTRHQIW